MSIFGKKGPADLAEWLEIATDGLASSSRRRIAAEIEAHYAEAVDAYVALGEPEPVAQAKALGELGNAGTSRRRFRTEHLTKWQENWLEEFQHGMGSKISLVIILLLGCAFEATLIIKLHSIGKIAVCVLIGVIFLVLPTVTFRRLRQLENKSDLSSVSAIALTHTALTCVSLVFCACISHEGFMFLSGMPAFFILFIHSFRTWRKFRNHKSPKGGRASVA